jgi:homogentisate 1,2-dioxygenase
VRGALRWETEMGAVILKEGEVLVIPKGVLHCSMLCDKSIEENVLIELNCTDKLNYVGDKK